MKKFVSWNVNGLRALEGRGFCGIVKNLDADILAVQETKAGPEQLSDDLKNIPGYSSFFAAAARKGYSGVGVYVKEKPLDVVIGLGVSEFDDEGRVITLEYGDFFLVNAYFPNAQDKLARIGYKLKFNERLLEHAGLLAQKKTVLVTGDFNVAHRPIDLARPKENEGNPGYSQEERDWMDKFLAAGWVDTFRMFHPEPGAYSWWSYRAKAREKNVGWRIDYFCVDEKSRGRVRSAFIEKDVMGSDHCPVGMTFE